LRVCAEIGSREVEAENLRLLGAACETLGEIGRAVEYYRRSLKISHEISNHRAISAAHAGLTGALAKTGHMLGEVKYGEVE